MLNVNALLNLSLLLGTLLGQGALLALAHLSTLQLSKPNKPSDRCVTKTPTLQLFNLSVCRHEIKSAHQIAVGRPRNSKRQITVGTDYTQPQPQVPDPSRQSQASTPSATVGTTRPQQQQPPVPARLPSSPRTRTPCHGPVDRLTLQTSGRVHV